MTFKLHNEKKPKEKQCIDQCTKGGNHNNLIIMPI